MRTENPLETRDDAALRDVHERIERWRQTRTKRTAMPEYLWDAAVSLTDTRSVYQVSRALRVNYSRLKLKSQPRNTALGDNDHEPSKVNHHEPSHFVQLDASSLFGSAQGGPLDVVELVDPRGARMTLRLASTQGIDLIGLSRAFFGQRP